MVGVSEAESGMVDVTIRPDCGIIEQVVAAIRRERERIESLAPCRLTVHIPPLESKEPVVLEITAKLK